jgi:hypothetical protein
VRLKPFTEIATPFAGDDFLASGHLILPRDHSKEAAPALGRPSLMQAPPPRRRHGNFDKIQMIRQQHPSLGID